MNEDKMSPETNHTPEHTPEAPKETPPIVKPVKKKSHFRSTKTFLAVLGVAVVLAIGGLGGAYISQLFESNANPSLNSGVDGNATVTDAESSIASVAEKVGPSVVSIITQTRSASSFGASGEAAGTGIIVSKDGYIMTNNHVLESATDVSVVDSKGELYEDVTIIGRDPLNDVAFLKIKSDKTFTAAELGNSSTIRTGQQVVAIGNALGQYSNTVTSGIISGTGRPITADTATGETESLTDLIQTDASINPGNSGGPLVNMAGQVIGINTAIVEDANGIGFAIPINATKGVLAGVLETGKVSRSYLGVNYLTVTPDVAREYNLSVNSGAYIYATGTANPVASGSPAEKAGLKSGDIIIKINNETLGTQGSLSSILGQYRPDDKLTITYLRDGNEKTTTVTLNAYKG
jgi:Trypsin-like serine proteases, typically periplasmic, contain C-terminal PDZ domain